MNDNFLRKKFVFNDKIDSEYLFSLYEDDFLYIEEIFKTTLDQLNTVVPEVQVAFNSGDINGLKRLVHKIKPAFGFTGLLETEQACKEFEDACTELTKSNDVAAEYHRLWALLNESMVIMQNQYAQLKESNTL
jgi:HPt (histidine-containing phosphotransfer) domain-containing protein